MLLKKKTNEFYIKSTFESEQELESIITHYAENIFGLQSIYLSQPVILTEDGRQTRPDGIVIDLLNKNRYIIEVELGIHDVWKHIIPQVSLQIVSSQSLESKEKIKNKLLESQHIEKFKEIGLNEIAIEPYLSSILTKEPIILIPIDFIKQDLLLWVKTIKYQVEIREINKYVGGDDDVYISFPDKIIEGNNIVKNLNLNIEEENNLETGRRIYNGSLNDLLVNNQLQVNETIIFNYSRRGGESIRKEGVVLEGGVIDVDGEKFNSLSSAGSYIIKKEFNISTAVNGRWYWYNNNGNRLFELRQDLESVL